MMKLPALASLVSFGSTGDHKSDRLGDINYYIKSFMATSEKAELTTSIHHIARFSKQEYQLLNLRYLFYANVK